MSCIWLPWYLHISILKPLSIFHVYLYPRPKPFYLLITHGNDTSKYHILPFVRTVSDYINMIYFKKECISVVYNLTKIKLWQILYAINKDIYHCTVLIHLWVEQMLIIQNLKMRLVNVIFNLACYSVNVFHCVNLHLLSQASLLGL